MPAVLGRARMERIEREATLSEIHEVVGYLRSHLGQQITAYLSGLRDARVVGMWVSRRVAPRPAAKMRLREAYRAAKLLVQGYGDETARSWFFGTNTRLDDEAPALVLRHARTPEDLRSVVPAARSFAGAAD